MGELLFKQGLDVLRGSINAVFPEGGVARLSQLGIVVIFQALGQGSLFGKVLDLQFEAERRVHKALLGGYAMPGTFWVYSDKIVFEPHIPKLLRALYDKVERVEIPGDSIVDVKRSTASLIYDVIDVSLTDGTFRFAGVRKLNSIEPAFEAVKKMDWNRQDRSLPH